jgi:twitching motility protein PilJ
MSMAQKSTGARLLPALTGLLVLLLVAAGALQFASDFGRDARSGTSGPTAGELINETYIQAAIALEGDRGAFDRLATLAGRISGTSTGLTAQQREIVQQASGSARALADARDVVMAAHVAASDMGRWRPELADSALALETALVAPGPAATADLTQLKLVADGALRDLQALARGRETGNGLSQRLVDAEATMVTLAARLAVTAVVAENGAADAMARIDDAVANAGRQVRDVLANADSLTAVAQARAQLEAAARQATSLPRSRAGAGGQRPIWPEWLPLSLLAAALVVLAIMAWTYYRAEDLRRAAEIQAEQTERNQQAILTLLDELSSLADGDLTVQATVTEDITGAIADSINFAIEALRDLVMTIDQSAALLDTTARGTDLSARSLAEASETQSRQIAAASDSVAKMAASIEEVSGNAERSSDVARHSVDVAHKGGEAVRRTIEGMNAIRETIQDTSKRIKRLGESSQEIGNIVELINDIADQTNILALNASIQASMAGEAGRGFAVVADEVQRLAERSANATRQIEVLVRTIQSDTNEAIVSMERSTTDVVGGALLAENAGAALEEIEQVSNQIALLVQNISGSAREQATAASGITHNMGAVRDISSQTTEITSTTTDSIR